MKAFLAALFGFLIILQSGEAWECRACNAVVFQGSRLVLLVLERGGDVIPVGQFEVSDVKAIVELRDEV
jgi:hypothetical protein